MGEWRSALRCLSKLVHAVRPCAYRYHHLLSPSPSQAGKASGEYCDDFSILADICVDMPKLWGCEGYVALCKTTGTAVKQCTNRTLLRRGVRGVRVHVYLQAGLYVKSPEPKSQQSVSLDQHTHLL